MLDAPVRSHLRTYQTLSLRILARQYEPRGSHCRIRHLERTSYYGRSSASARLWARRKCLRTFAQMSRNCILSNSFAILQKWGVRKYSLHAFGLTFGSDDVVLNTP